MSIAIMWSIVSSLDCREIRRRYLRSSSVRPWRSRFGRSTRSSSSPSRWWRIIERRRIEMSVITPDYRYDSVPLFVVDFYAVKHGDFTKRDGGRTDTYVDLRGLPGHAESMRFMARHLQRAIRSGLKIQE